MAESKVDKIDLSQFEDEIKRILKKECSEPLKVVKTQMLEPERTKIYATLIPKYEASSSHLLSVICESTYDEKDEDNCEKIFLLKKTLKANNSKRKLDNITNSSNAQNVENHKKKRKLNNSEFKNEEKSVENEKESNENKDDLYSYYLELINVVCLITYDDISPNECVEYTFNDKDWYISQISYDSFMYYKKQRFKIWKELITNTKCQATFKRLLNIGLVNRMYDRKLFMPKEDSNEWEITLENGRIAYIPRMIKNARVYDCVNRKYKIIDSLLDDAPNDEQCQSYWNEMLQEFRNTRGEEFINQLLDDKK